ncbi:hypothetical protein [Roseivirga misakiensis]|uniref:Uncharacterized protein n=1 Tax=Roseivirga misakiensis TaxID=1563681 RepID=A0A1E5SZ70_9BACT|nr:hypothetical protein [Roseivirga misakiensis]OEK04411.1 hypothetical protein BFP71_13100 [Roseivirga misakiensis]
MSKIIFSICLIVFSPLILVGKSQTCDSCQVSVSDYYKNLEKDLKKSLKLLEDTKKAFETYKEEQSKEVDGLYYKLDSLSQREQFSYFYNSHVGTRFRHMAWLAFALPLGLLIGAFFLGKRIAPNFDFKRALSEIKIINNKDHEIESTSRLIAFLSGAIAIVLSLTIIVFTLFIYLTTGIMTEFDVLVDPLLALGIGVVPYSINRVTGAFKNNNT